MNINEMIELLDRNKILDKFIIGTPKKLIKLKTIKNKTKHLEHKFDGDVKVIINKDSIHSIHVTESNYDAVMMMHLYTHSADDELIFTFEDKIYNIDNFIESNELTIF